jgi:hydrogenase 3 maturation protease
MLNPQLAPALTKALTSLRHKEPLPAGGAVVLLGVGSELRSDDAAGIRVAERVKALGLAGIHALAGGPAPENLTGLIRQLSPSLVIIVDAADMGLPPGTVRLLQSDEIGGMSFSTHTLPLNVLADYLQKETGCSLLIMGIQPRSLAFDGALSAEVAAAVEETVGAIAACLSSSFSP